MVDSIGLSVSGLKFHVCEFDIQRLVFDYLVVIIKLNLLFRLLNDYFITHNYTVSWFIVAQIQCVDSILGVCVLNQDSLPVVANALSLVVRKLSALLLSLSL